MKNYADLGGCHLPKPKAESNTTPRHLHNSTYIIRKPNSITITITLYELISVLLLIQNITRALETKNAFFSLCAFAIFIM